MKIFILGNTRQLVCKLVMLFVFAIIAGCDSNSMIPKLFSQCVAGIESLEGFPQLTDGLVIDAQQQCYASRWNIPPAYKPYLPRNNKKESIEIVVGLPELTPGALLPNERVAAENPQIAIHSLITSSFSDILKTKRAASEAFYDVKPTGVIMFGMEVYETTKFESLPGQVLFYPQDGGDAMVVCPVGVEQGVEQIKKNVTCNVVSNIGNKFYAEYSILYELMPSFSQINRDLVSLVNSFIAP